MKACVFDAWSPGDPALVNSHWVAERTADALLRGVEGAIVEVVEGAAVDHARVLAELNRPRDGHDGHDGFVYCGHGREYLLHRELDERGNPVPIVGAQDLLHVGPRWFHAFACLSGHTLCRDAVAAGADAFLGYAATVNVNWEPSALPEELRALLQELVTVATVHLARGERSRRALRVRVREASDSLVGWLDRHDDERDAMHMRDLIGLYALSSTLHGQLVLEGLAVVP